MTSYRELTKKAQKANNETERIIRQSEPSVHVHLTPGDIYGYDPGSDRADFPLVQAPCDFPDFEGLSHNLEWGQFYIGSHAWTGSQNGEEERKTTGNEADYWRRW